MTFDCPKLMAMRTWLLRRLDTKAKNSRRLQREARHEFRDHARSLTQMASVDSAFGRLSPVRRLNKTRLSVFHGALASIKTTVQGQSQ